MIELHFGNSINARFEEVINERAIEWDCSFDLAYTPRIKCPFKGHFITKVLTACN